jgi:hypothetical protein
MRSVFAACRPLAWIAIGISDAYLALVLLFAAILSDDGTFATRRAWITRLFPKRTTGLFVVTLLLLSIVSGFAGLYVGTQVFPGNKMPGDALYISLFTLAFTVNSHAHREFRMTLQCPADFQRAQYRRFWAAAKNKPRAIAGWQTQQLAFCFSKTALFCSPHNLF